MAIKIYGTKNCIDCVNAIERLQSADMDFEFIEFNDSIANLKQFLVLRDSLPIYAEVRKEGYIGIPTFVSEEGKITLDIDTIMNGTDDK